MTNKEALQSVINMADNLYKKDVLNHILKNDLEITEHQQEAIYQMNDYLTDVMED
tara:strand:- start:241 stop:405 length:165 start_codon:yes stop_codon:yes gene_type:complete